MLTEEELVFLHTLVDCYSDVLEKYCLRCLSNVPDRAHLAQDIVQSAYLAAFQNVSALMHHENVLGWMKVVCHNHIVDEIKQRKREASISFPNDIIEKQLDQQAIVSGLYRWEQITLEDVLEAVVSILTKDEQAIFDSYFLQGHTMKETATQQGLRFDVVRGKVYSIKKKLLKIFSSLCISILFIRYIL